MLFSSPIFFAFFAVYFLLHRVTPPRYRVYLIICGSTVFYAWWKVEFVWIPYLLVAIAFCGVAWMERAVTPPARKRRLITVIIIMFLPLAGFKYTNFLYQDVLGIFFTIRGRLIDLALPLGISFITFTLSAYVIDIYRNRFRSGQKLSTVLAYVLFFPHLIAGPILRPNELIPQLEHPRQRSGTSYRTAIAIFTVGLVKKLVFADSIAKAVDSVYGAGGLPGSAQGLLALYGFSVQIYCDFSGYTDMAIGIALLLGIRLPPNFARPYLATSLTDFWHRWHRTLSFWLRDYLYIPLGGNRSGAAKQWRNIMITMILGGLWHGAHWTFVLWGLIHGLGLSAVHLFKRLRIMPPLPRWIAVLITFHFVAVAWVFFRASDIKQAMQILSAPFIGHWNGAPAFIGGSYFPLFLIVAFFLLHPFDDYRRIKWEVRRLRPEIAWAIIICLWVLAITISQGSSANFIYFDF